MGLTQGGCAPLGIPGVIGIPFGKCPSGQILVGNFQRKAKF